MSPSPHSKTQHGQTGRGSSPRGETAPSLGLVLSPGAGSLGSAKAPAPVAQKRQVPAVCLSHGGGLREVGKPVFARGRGRDSHSQLQCHCLQVPIGCHIWNLPTTVCSCRWQGQEHPQTRQPTLQGDGVWISFYPGLGGASLNAGRSLGLSLCQREASLLKPSEVGCWVPPWPPIILGHRHRAPR